MNYTALVYRTIIAAMLLLSVGCSSKSDWGKERVVASEAGSYALRSKAKTLKVPFVIENEDSARKAILAYLEANYPSALAKGIKGLDSIKLDESKGKTSFYVVLTIDTAQIAVFAPKGESEVSEVAIDVRLLE